MARQVVSASRLYSVLEREFQAARPDACRDCRIPLPYWHRPPDEVSANWSFGTPSHCRHGCHVIMAELLARLWTLYELQAPKESERLA
jgi:hypothetical protein